MQTLYILSTSIIISLGFIIYKKIAEPISLYLINQSIKITKEEYEEVVEGIEILSSETEKLEKAIQRGE